MAIAVAAAPAAWFAHLLVSYLLVPVACEQGNTLPLHLTTVVTAVAATAGGLVAARSRRLARDGGTGRAFVALAGLAMSPLFVVLILVGGLSPVLIGSCPG